MTAPAVAYVRVSSSGQAADDRDGLPRQRRAVAAFCRSKRLALIEEHADPGISGTTPLAGRAGLSRALERCKELGAVLVVERPDRLSRDLVVGELALAAFREAGVQVLDTAGTDLTAGDGNATAVLVRQLLGAVAQHDKAAIVARLRAAKDRIRSAGGHAEGPRAFGSDPARPHEAALLDRVRELRRRVPGRKRQALATIAATLNGEGHQTRSGLPWTAERIGDVLRA
jgi:DNA invertase Pin-like site-specific DNA recombinase